MVLAETQAYKVLHYAAASIGGSAGYEELVAWMGERGVEFGSLGDEVYTVDVATVHLTAAHFAALKAGDDERVDLNDLCSSLLSDEEPDWLQDGETVGDFEMELRIGMEPLWKWCRGRAGAGNGEAAAGGISEGDVLELLGEIVEGGGMTDSVWIEEAGAEDDE